jgi:hypothetical protein
MVSHSLALDQLTPEIAAELLRRTEWHGDRRQYAVFAVRRFVTYLVTQGVVKSPAPTARELVRAGLRGDNEDYLRRQRGLSERTIGHCRQGRRRLGPPPGRGPKGALCEILPRHTPWRNPLNTTFHTVCKDTVET